MPMHNVWHRVRGPFRCLQCTEHKWEQYDCDKAGCLSCGARHQCSSAISDSQCDLVTMDDASICCAITGFCPPCVRYSTQEYVGDTHVLMSSCAPASNNVDIWSVVNHIVVWFLVGNTTREIRNNKLKKILTRQHNLFIKSVRKHKLGSQRRFSLCIPEMFAIILHEQTFANCSIASDQLCHTCTNHITRCITDLDWARFESKHMRMVVGLLYLMKKGLIYNNVQWLQAVPELAACLPPESVLEKQFNLSMKLVCDTENEVKLTLRQRLHML
jgi:hypothetical protein